MNKIAIVVLAGTKLHESLERVVNALELAKKLQEHDDDVEIIFDGAGTEVKESEIDLLSEYDQHPSLRAFIADDYQIVTF